MYCFGSAGLFSSKQLSSFLFQQTVFNKWPLCYTGLSELTLIGRHVWNWGILSITISPCQKGEKMGHFESFTPFNIDGIHADVSPPLALRGPSYNPSPGDCRHFNCHPASLKPLKKHYVPPYCNLDIKPRHLPPHSRCKKYIKRWHHLIHSWMCTCYKVHKYSK